jgi:tetratricopeptide (TPR) repeat protein
MKHRSVLKLASNYQCDKDIYMKTKILLCGGLLAMSATMTLDSNRVMAEGLIQSNSRSIPKNALASERNAKYYYQSGNVKYDRGDYQGAIADYTRAIELNPNFDKAYFNRALAKHDLGDYSAAIADYSKSLKILPNNPKTYYSRGLSKDNLGDYSAAIADYNRAIALNPNYADAYNNRGASKGKLGDYSAAIADFYRSLKIDPNNSLTLGNLATAEGNLRGSQQQNTLDHINRVQNAQTCCR